MTGKEKTIYRSFSFAGYL